MWSDRDEQRKDSPITDNWQDWEELMTSENKRGLLTRRAFGLMLSTAAVTSALPLRFARGETAMTLKLGHSLTRGSHYDVAAVAFAEALKAKSGGKIDVQIFPQSQLGGEVQMIQALRVGTQDLVVTSQPAVVNTVKEWQVFDIPYLFTDPAEANAILQSPVGAELLALTKQRGIQGLSWLSAIERDVFTTKRQVTKLSDLEGLKIRVVQSPGYIKGYQALGANPTPLPYSELYLALQQGVVDGGELSPELAVQDKFAELAHFYAISRVNHSPIVLLMSANVYEKLSPDLKTAVDGASAEAAKLHAAEYRRQYDAALQEVKNRGIVVSNIDTTSWAEKTRPVRDIVAADTPNGAEWLKKIEAARSARAAKL
jgi:tripartite ATP-independent transporter DctP family solute receptor